MSQPVDRDSHESILEAHIRDLQGSERASFHMPGHKGGAGAPARGRALLGDQVYAADLSELSGFDYLHAARAALLEAQARAAQIFGARQSWYLVNGATVGNIAAICATVGDGDAVLVARDSHRSVYAGLALSGATPIYLPPVRNDHLDGLYGVDLAEVEHFLDEHVEIGAVHITSPSYYGFTAPVREIAALAHAHGVPLIVDEAHGAHFVFHDDFPSSALSCGADLVVQSPHKTLGSLTQSSLLHLQGDLTSAAGVASYLGMLQSSSPSALLLVSLDVAIEEMERTGKKSWAVAREHAARIRSAVNCFEGVTCYGDEVKNAAGISSFDPTKVVIDVNGLGTTGFAAGRWLRTEWQINPEFSDLRRMVFSVTSGDTNESTELLIDALRALAQNRHLFHAHPNLIALWPAMTPVSRLTPREAQQRAAISIPTREAVGEISGEMIVPYPPGVPLVVAGEEISAEIIETMHQLVSAGCRIVGPFDPTGATLRIIS
jgi:arginine/lysine/ornithine decarboxylase